MRPPRKVPNPYRCLNGIAASAAALLLLLTIWVVERVACAALGPASTSCSAFASLPYGWALLGAAGVGLAYTVWAAYRDFVRGKYYADLAEVQRH